MRCCLNPELRNFHESYEGGEGSGRLQVRQQAADLNNKSSAPQSEEVNYSAALGKFIMLVTSHARPVNTGHESADGPQ
ncbi:transcriptional regulator [Salmonella enterica subsp. enterica serovar Typhimurium]|nr:transcriptional regulator [Salmonella enterica subsp. enterica serovar Typhimurium]